MMRLAGMNYGRFEGLVCCDGYGIHEEEVWRVERGGDWKAGLIMWLSWIGDGE